MVKFLVTLLLFLALLIVLKNSNFFLKKSPYKENDFKIKEEKKYKIECELFNEIIDRTKRDLERQCYYNCSEDDIVRVDTSIEYICQPFIVEER
tara:strand:+ start:128 stop:409 length:282 start_codon:yes stop_codon:yes gene_type:complete